MRAVNQFDPLMRTHFVIASVARQSQRGNLVAVATAVRRRVFNLIQISARPEPVEGRSQ